MENKSWIMYIVYNSLYGYISDEMYYTGNISLAKLFWTREFAEAAIVTDIERVIEVRVTIEELDAVLLQENV